MTQKTPGYVDKRFEVHEGEDYVVILGPHDTTDSPAARVHGDTTEETLYFANLFAAAPDLLAALEMAATWFEDYSNQHYAKALTSFDRAEQHGRETKGKTNADRATILRAAIAKARGQ